MKTLSVLLLAASMVLAQWGCSDESPSLVGPASQTSVSSPVPNALSKKAEGSYSLQGLSLFSVIVKKTRVALEDPKEYNLPCSAELVFTDKQNFVLTTTEWLDTYGGTPFRIISFAGKRAPGGPLKYSWPATWLEVTNWETLTLETHSDVIGQFEDHTGIDVVGPGVNKNTVNYVGSFDGERFVAAFHMEGFQKRIGTMGAPFDVLHDGPISIEFSVDLKVVN